MRSQAGRRLADDFVDQIEQVVAQIDKPTDPQLPESVLPAAPMRQAYAVQILQRLHDPHPGTAFSLDFINDWLDGQSGGVGTYSVPINSGDNINGGHEYMPSTLAEIELKRIVDALQ